MYANAVVNALSCWLEINASEAISSARAEPGKSAAQRKRNTSHRQHGTECHGVQGQAPKRGGNTTYRPPKSTMSAARQTVKVNSRRPVMKATGDRAPASAETRCGSVGAPEIVAIGRSR